MGGAAAADITTAGAITTIATGTEQSETKSGASRTFRITSPAPLRAQPEAEGDRHHSRQTEPADGVLQMVVLETDVERAGLYAGDKLRRLQIDVERRNGLAIAIPAEGARHGQMVAREPQLL